mmetsp:Transcript_92743/g.215532  ORF Transcript_92743/g.215532 Transcript_92743/m.215532 type:complete len:211 (-) Transcript_92743:1084-1716(-)
MDPPKCLLTGVALRLERKELVVQRGVVLLHLQQAGLQLLRESGSSPGSHSRSWRFGNLWGCLRLCRRLASRMLVLPGERRAHPQHDAFHVLQPTFDALHLVGGVRGARVHELAQVHHVLDSGGVGASELQQQLHEVEETELLLIFAACAIALKDHLGKVDKTTDVDACLLQIPRRLFVIEHTHQFMLRDEPVVIKIYPVLFEDRPHLVHD